MRITSKGQITVPKKLRDRFGITKDTEIEFQEQRGKLVLVKKQPEAAVRTLRNKVERLPFGKNVDDYVGITRGDR